MLKPMRAGGGWAAILYSLRKARAAGGLWRLYRRLRLKNACKTCALGMGGTRGGMVNEAGRFPEVCKKSVQAQASDMQGPIPESFFADHPFDRMGRMGPRELDASGRLAFPLLAAPGDAGYRRISWEEAYDRVAEALRAASPAESFFYASGRASNEAAFLLQCFARAWGTRNINNCSYYCHQASGVGMGRAFGTGTGTVTLEDLEHADLAFVIGANPASNHPRLITQLVDLRARGGQVIVVNPLRELGLTRFRIPSRPGSLLFGSRVSDLYLQPHIGGDAALLAGLAKHVLETGAADRGFLAAHTQGWERVEAHLAATPWERIVRDSGVPWPHIADAAERYIRSRNTVFFWAMGITQHLHGVDNVQAIANLACMRGMVGRPGAGLMPIRGHSNVQGVGSVGFTPALKDAFARAFTQAYGLPADAPAGWDTFAAMDAAEQGRVRFAWYHGGNLFGANPDREHAARAMRRVETAVFVSTTLNESHVHGRGATTLVLPALTRDEERQSTSQESMFNYVRLSHGGAQDLGGYRRPGEARSEVELVTEVAHRVLGDGGPFDWLGLRDHREVRRQIARVVPGYRPAADMSPSKPGGGEFQVQGRTFHTPRFNTPDGLARLAPAPLPEQAGPRDPAAGRFLLMTLRSEGQFNTVVYEEEDLYRGQERRDIVLMNAGDARALGLRENTPVTVQSEAGRMENLRVRYADIRSGNLAAYYPEANVLVPRRVDPASKTPAFKSVAVQVQASRSAASSSS